MKETKEHIELKFYEVLKHRISLQEFENWVYELKELKPSDLTVVEILKHHTAKAIYGGEARENTVLINTRNMNSK
jgi:hypothetical protein